MPTATTPSASRAHSWDFMNFTSLGFAILCISPIEWALDHYRGKQTPAHVDFDFCSQLRELRLHISQANRLLQRRGENSAGDRSDLLAGSVAHRKSLTRNRTALRHFECRKLFG